MTNTSKLSKLQRAILDIAKRNAAEDKPTFYSQILVEFYGFPSRSNPRRPGGWKFNRTAIGPQRYDAALSAVSRAAGRLEHRGLIYFVTGLYAAWIGIRLTATETVESPPPRPESQPFPGRGL